LAAVRFGPQTRTRSDGPELFQHYPSLDLPGVVDSDVEVVVPHVQYPQDDLGI
jgi:hypothetical protein